jgi:hypothetical protein
MRQHTLVCLLSLCLVLPAAAQTPPLPELGGNAQIMYAPFATAGERICGRIPQKGEEPHWLDFTESYISERVCRAGVWFDSFFIDEREIEENVDRFIRVFNNFEYKQRDGLDWRIRVNARIQLPGLKERFSLMLSDDSEKDLTQRSENTQFRASTLESASPITGNRVGDLREAHNLSLRWGVVSTPQQDFSVRIRARLNELLTPSLIGRYRYSHGMGKNSLARFTQSIFWEKEEGFGETSRLDLERLLHPDVLLRWSNIGTFSENSDGLDWGSILSLKHSMSERAAFSYDASIEGVTRPNTHPTKYRLGMRYRQNFLRPWLFFEIEPSYSWIENLERELYREAAIVFRLEAHFGRKRR